MEKYTIIFSILTHDYDFMLWFWGLITLPVAMWQSWCFDSKKPLSGNELGKLSSKFSGINGQYMLFSTIWLLGVLGLPTLFLSSRIDTWAVQNYGMRFYPISAIFIGGYGIYQGLFAMISGVYPQMKSLSYIHDDITKIWRVAKTQITVSIVAILAAILFFLNTAGV